MTIRTIDELKSYFNQGDVPTEQNYIDLFDTMFSLIGDMPKSTYDPDDDGKVESSDAADAVPWSGISSKPSNLMLGPTSSIDHHVPQFKGTGGNELEDSGREIGGMIHLINPVTILSGSALSAGLHTYDVTSYGISSGVYGVRLRALAYWTAANNSYSMDLKGGSGYVYGSCRAMVANMYYERGCDVDVELSTNHIEIYAAGGVQVDSAYLIITGYLT